MKDRVSLNPGRALISPENGSAAFYATITRADGPTQEGDPLNKSTFLKDATAALYGLGVDATPDDVLVKLGALYDLRSYIAMGSYVGTGNYGSSNPNTLTFDFEPKMLFIYARRYDASNKKNVVPLYFILTRDVSNQEIPVYWLDTDGVSNTDKFEQFYSVISNFSDNTVSWYGTSSGAAKQANQKCTHYYIAIG